jgi:hypothetical protein
MPGRKICKNCGAVTHFGNAVAEREMLGWCTACFKKHHGPTLREPPKPAEEPTWFEVHGTSALPEPRPDGQCANCGKEPAVTRDRRFCKSCLWILVNRLNPGSVWHGSLRSTDHKQARDTEPSPWGENALRSLEDG